MAGLSPAPAIFLRGSSTVSAEVLPVARGMRPLFGLCGHRCQRTRMAAAGQKQTQG